jgi:hypothetical protein
MLPGVKGDAFKALLERSSEEATSAQRAHLSKKHNWCRFISVLPRNSIAAMSHRLQDKVRA